MTLAQEPTAKAAKSTAERIVESDQETKELLQEVELIIKQIDCVDKGVWVLSFEK